MNWKKYLIIVGIFLIALGFVIPIYFSVNNNKEKISKELKYYQDLFTLELVTEENGQEYFIKGFKKDGIIFDLRIPNTIDNIPVTKLIGKGQNFYDYVKIQKIIIPPSINFIGIIKNGHFFEENIFQSASDLHTIEVDANNQSYYSQNGILYTKDQKTILRYPIALGTVGFTYEIDSNVEEIGNHAFYGNKFIQNIVFNNGLIKVGREAFANSKSLAIVNFSTTVEEIDVSAFESCQKITNLFIPTNIKKLGFRAFSYCTTLVEVTMQAEIEEIGLSIFTGCHQLTNILTTLSFSQYLENNRNNLGIISTVNINVLQNS